MGPDAPSPARRRRTPVWKIVICIALGAGIGLVLDARARRATSAAMPPDVVSQAKVPRFLELGSSVCVPCKAMSPILEELRKEYSGRLRVDFIDVRESPKAGEPYAVRSIPTQIFFDAEGKEIFRHEGFFAKDKILAKWKELGIELGED